jgi:hypothetical protein
MLIIVLIVVVAVVLSLPRTRGRIVEEIKAASDHFLVNFLRATSGFGAELTEDGKTEQKLWREQRWRNLRGLALRSKEAFSNQQSVKKGQEK